MKHKFLLKFCSKREISVIFLLLLFFLLSNFAFALKSDKYKLLHISSNSLKLNYGDRTADYIGNVISDQGSRHLSGDSLKLFQNNHGKIYLMRLTGNPARGHYLSKLNGSYTYAKSKIMIYQPPKNLITFKENVRITQDGNVFIGPLVTYNTKTEIMKTPYDNNGNKLQVMPYNDIKKTS